MKDEPAWMREFRLKAYELFMAKPMPTWGDTQLLNEIDFADIHYFVKSTDQTERSWDDVPEDIKRTFDRLGIPEAERKFLSGVSAQYESRSRLPQHEQGARRAGRAVLRHGHRRQEIPGDRAKVFRDGDSAGRQQICRAELRGLVGRVVHLRAAGRRSRRCRCRPTSGSTPRTWASSSAR